MTAATDNANAIATLAGDADIMWIMVCGILVFFMQAGFSMLEAGTVSTKNTRNILFKNLMDAAIGCICFWLFGYGFAYGNGEDSKNVFIGTDDFALSEMNKAGGWHNFFFQWAFAATAATIVSGAVAERCKISAYFTYTVVLTTFIYPVVVHWVWDSEGWLSAFGEHKMLTGDATKSMGLVDFAGSGVVHMVGGFSSLTGAYFVGPRTGRFQPGFNTEPSNPLVCSLGIAILWMGWYGFNCGSTLAISGYSTLVGSVAVTTSLAASAGAVTCMVTAKIAATRAEKKGEKAVHWDLMGSLNGVLAGLVSITAGCATTKPWHAVVIGTIGAFVYMGASKLLVKLKIDDPLEACPIHGFCGMWGVLAVGIFSTDHNLRLGYGIDDAMEPYATGAQFATQAVGALAILSWTLVTSGIMFFIINKTMGMRVAADVELEGLDISEHAGTEFKATQDKDELITALERRIMALEKKAGVTAAAHIGVNMEGDKSVPDPAPQSKGDVAVHVQE